MDAPHHKEVAMLKKLLILAAGLALAAPALADRGHGHQKRHWKPPHHSHYHGRPVVVVPPARFAYVPPPRVVYAPPPVVYYAPPPARVYYAPPPVVHRAPAPAGGVSIRLHFPL
jgi:hypothetical protein